jgi:hypothetical protein
LKPTYWLVVGPLLIGDRVVTPGRLQQETRDLWPDQIKADTC